MAKKNGNTVSPSTQVKKRQRHGASHAPEYKAWRAIKSRCLNPNDRGFEGYGGRGITICPEWIDDYLAFFSHIGQRPTNKHSVDRINNSKGYEPGNVRWATGLQQSNNTRHNRIISIDGESRTVAEWAKVSGLKPDTLHSRLRLGIPINDILSPVGTFSSRKPKPA